LESSLVVLWLCGCLPRFDECLEALLERWSVLRFAPVIEISLVANLPIVVITPVAML